MAVDGSAVAAWGIAAVATAGVMARPFRRPEAIWAVAGAISLVAFGLLPWTDAVRHPQGSRRLLFLAGMMLIAEVARKEGVFDWAAALAVSAARGSPQRLFALVYAVGTVVTVLLSNDATAVVLTPVGLCRDPGRRRNAAALFVRLRLHCQRGEFCAADFQSGQPGGVRRPHAAPRGVA